MHTYTHVSSTLFLQAMTKPAAQRVSQLAVIGQQILEESKTNTNSKDQGGYACTKTLPKYRV